MSDKTKKAVIQEIHHVRRGLVRAARDVRGFLRAHPRDCGCPVCKDGHGSEIKVELRAVAWALRTVEQALHAFYNDPALLARARRLIRQHGLPAALAALGWPPVPAGPAEGGEPAPTIVVGPRADKL